MGDININITKDSQDRNCEPYLNLMASLGLLPGHTYPTRINSCLDHVMAKVETNTKIMITDSAITDHALVITNLSMDMKHKTDNIYVNKTNYSAAIKSIESADFSFISPMCNADSAAEKFVEILSTAITSNTIVVKIPRSRRTLKAWMTPGLIRCIRHRDKLHQQSKKNPDNEVLNISYKRYRNFCNSLLRKLRRQYEKHLLQKAKNNKDTWAAINTISGRNKVQNHANDLIKDNPYISVEKANLYFSNIGRNLADKINTNSNVNNYTGRDCRTLHSFVLLPPDESEVESTLLSLKNDCAVGWDLIPAIFLKIVKDIIIVPLTTLFKACFEQGCFPKAFKRAIITPVYKSGCRDSVENYRPISVLSALSKILERLLNNRLVKYLTKYNILSASQFGFRAGISTEVAVNSLTEFVTNKLDKNQKCVGVFLDLAKAFDTVSIPILVNKLESIGIRNSDIFIDFLRDRVQRVKISNIISSDVRVTFGVPQGSILGPSLFLIYINDLCSMSLTGGKIFTYADDTAIIFYGKSWEEVQNSADRGLQTVAHWLKQNLLTLNISKTTYLQFRISNVIPKTADDNFDINLKVHSCDLQQTDKCSCISMTKSKTVKYLGVLLDDRLSWLPHIELISSRTRILTWVFKKLRYVADFDLLRTIYFALAQSIIGYCISVWGGACKSFLIKLERSQRCLLKTMKFKGFRYPTNSLYKECNVLNVRQLFILNLIVAQHKGTQYDPDICRNKRRIPNILNPFKCRTQFARRQNAFLSVSLYNKLNKILNFYPLSKHECKMKVQKWLLTLDYKNTENLLTYSN